MQERLQKIISRAGLASRRAGEEIILAGRVRVNGHLVTELGAKADLFADTIEVDGRRVVPEAARYLVLHKPRGVVSTLSDPEGRPTVASLLTGAGVRLYPVGRLDFATSGVLLVTNDGDFANGLLHPRGGVPKMYVVKTNGVMTEDDLEHWRNGVQLEDGKTRPADVHFLRHEDGKTWFEVTLREGRNQQLRRMGEATGFPVMRLARTSFAGIDSEGLRPGQWRSLTLDELLALRQEYGVPRKVRGAALHESGGTTMQRASAGRPAASGGHGGHAGPRPREAAEERREARPRRPVRGAEGVTEARPTRSTRGAEGAHDTRPTRSTRTAHPAEAATEARARRPGRSAAPAEPPPKHRPRRPDRANRSAEAAQEARPQRAAAGPRDGQGAQRPHGKTNPRSRAPQAAGQGGVQGGGRPPARRGGR